MAGTGCPGLQAINPVCQAGNAVSSVVGAGASSVFDALTNWVADGATWLTTQIGDVLGSSTSIDVGAKWFDTHYRVMLTLLGVLVLPMLLGSLLQAIVRQDAGALIRSTFVHLPLAMVLAGGAIKIVQLALAATDSLCATVSSGSGADLQGALAGIGKDLGTALADPGVSAFVVLLGALLVVLGALALWVELLLRAAAVYVAVLFLPLALISLVWPAISHWFRRLVESLAALILSKLVIVAILSLAAGALASGVGAGSSAQGSSGAAAGGGLPAVLAGAALLLMAAFSPYTLLRLIPMVESGAVAQLEGIRHRVQRTATSVPQSAASFALRQAQLASFDPGAPGTGRTSARSLPGTEEGGGEGAGEGSGIGGPGGGAGGGEGSVGGGDPADSIPMWPGSRASVEAFEAVMSAYAATGESPPEQSGTGQSATGQSGSGGSEGPGSPIAGAGGVGAGGSGAPGAKPPVRRRPAGGPTRLDGPGVHIITRDDMGPVIKWIPPDMGGDGTGSAEEGDGDGG